MTYDDLLDLAIESNIKVNENVPFAKIKSMALDDNNDKSIALSTNIKTMYERKVCLCHEYNHIKHGDIYKIADFSPCRSHILSKAEYNANANTYRMLVPIRKLCYYLYTEKLHNYTELAEKFDVDVSTIENAIAHYRTKNILPQQYEIQD